MNLKSIIAASVLATSMMALGTVNSYAVNQSIDFSSGSASFVGIGPLLEGGDDLLSFTGLETGTYNFDFTLSTQYIDSASVHVNGQLATSYGGGIFKFFGLSSVSTTPFSVLIEGTSNSKSLYSGELQVSAVPEAGTYLLLIAGLGMVCLAARHRMFA